MCLHIYPIVFLSVQNLLNFNEKSCIIHKMTQGNNSIEHWWYALRCGERNPTKIR
jgi:hypothetical protein